MMRVVDQTLDEILDSLSPLDVDWMDDLAADTIAHVTGLERKPSYGRSDIAAMLDENFAVGILTAQLFLGLSGDQYKPIMAAELGGGSIERTRYRKDREAFLDALERLGLPEKMAATVNREVVWSDVLVERLRLGRGRAIAGQKRGRGLEDFVEALIKEVFGEGGYHARGTFTGEQGRTAKFDFAIPNRERPRIVLEVKGYGATGSKMTDVIRDLDSIIGAMRRDTTLLFFTDGLTWRSRASDLRAIVSRQNDGKITRIYTTGMRDQFLADLRTLKVDCGL